MDLGIIYDQNWKDLYSEEFLLLLEGYNIIIKRNWVFSMFENDKYYGSNEISVWLGKYLEQWSCLNYMLP